MSLPRRRILPAPSVHARLSSTGSAISPSRSVSGFVSQMFHSIEARITPLTVPCESDVNIAGSAEVATVHPPANDSTSASPASDASSSGNSPVAPLVSPTPIRLDDVVGLQMLAAFDPDVEIVFTDDFSDIEVEDIMEVLLNPPTPSPGQRAKIYMPNAKVGEVIAALRAYTRRG